MARWNDTGTQQKHGNGPGWTIVSSNIRMDRYTDRLDNPRGAMFQSMFVWALVLGGIGFLGGLFGSSILLPGSDQGPLIGTFISGPAGLLLGLAIGTWRWVSK